MIGFESTIWTIIMKAKQKDPDALEKFVSKYRPPVIQFLISKGFSDHDSEDIAQEVFFTIFKDNVLQKADESKGRFRSLILAVTENVMKLQIRKQMTKKRGGNQKVISLDEPRTNSMDSLEYIVTTKREEEEFDKLWLLKHGKACP
jgi:RNA polymerase sigma-70 factor (ECF subfamily)